MNFIVDAQLPPALARWIEERGHAGRHVVDIGLDSAADLLIWEKARLEQLVIVSKDEDFVDQWLLSRDPVSLIWVRKGNCSNAALIHWLEPLWAETIRRLEQGEKLVELRA